MSIKILFIDDEYGKNKWHYDAYKDEWGVDNVFWANTIKQTLDKIDAGIQYDVVIFDIMLPASDDEKKLLGLEGGADPSYNTGLSLAKIISNKLPNAVLLAVSARIDIDSDTRKKYNFIDKPERSQVIIDKVKNLLDNKTKK